MSVMAQPYKCDAPGCARVRENDANHWWLVRVRVSLRRGGLVELLPWNPVLAKHPAYVSACGLNCLLTLASRAADEIICSRTQSACHSEAVHSEESAVALSEKSESGENENATITETT